MKEWKRGIYIVAMAFVMISSGIFLTQITLPGENGTLFHFNAFGIVANITGHFIVNVVLVLVLLNLYLTSCRNYLMAVDVKHVTTISKK